MKINEFSLSYLASIIDYLIVFGLLYFLYKSLKGTKAFQIFLGFVILYLFKNIALELHLTNVSKGLSFIFENLIIFILIIFQDEIKQLVNKIYNKWLLFSKSDKDFSYKKEIISAIEKFSKNKTGSLIILEGENPLSDMIEIGTKLNSDISEELILSIFENKSALHDGAIIIKDNLIQYARSILPVSKNDSLHFRFGTRHRAAVGISEISDCLSILTSEETGKIRISYKGKIEEVSLKKLSSKINQFYRKQEKKQDSWISTKLVPFINKLKKIKKKIFKK